MGNVRKSRTLDPMKYPMESHPKLPEGTMFFSPKGRGAAGIS